MRHCRERPRGRGRPCLTEYLGVLSALTQPLGQVRGGRDDKKTTHVGNEEDHFTDGTKKGMKYIVKAAVASAHMPYIL